MSKQGKQVRRDQAIKDVSEALGCEISDIQNCLERKTISMPYMVAQRERVLELEQELSDSQKERDEFKEMAKGIGKMMDFNMKRLEAERDSLAAEIERLNKEGYVLVPRKPTEAMLEAAYYDALAEDAAGVWREMIAEVERLQSTIRQMQAEHDLNQEKRDV